MTPPVGARRFLFAVAVLCLGASSAVADDPPPIPVPAPPVPTVPPTVPPTPDAPPVPEPAPAPVPAPTAPPVPALGPTPAPVAPEAPAAVDGKPPSGADAPNPATDAAKPAEEPPKPDEAKKEEPKKDEAKKEEPKTDDAPAADAASKAAAVAALPPMLSVCAPIPPSPCDWRGVATLRLRGRTNTDGDHDFDLYESLRMQYRKDSDSGWSGSFYGRLAQDLDGNGTQGQFQPFRDVDASYRGLLTGRLYHLYASYRSDCSFIERVRIGRQDVDGGYPFLVDGVHVTTAPRGQAEFQATAFVGLPAHLYEGTPEGDFIGGAGAAFRPWTDADARLDWVYVVDENRYYGQPRNNLFTGELRQKFTSCASGRLWYEQVDTHPREIGASGLSYFPEHDLSLRGSFRSQLDDENSLVYDVDTFSAILLTLRPYWDAHLSASKGFENLVTLEGGVTARGLWLDRDEGTFNREFARLYATVSRDCFPRRDVTVSLTGEYWASHDDVFAGGFDVTWKASPTCRFSGGVDYALYRTDLYTGSERYSSYGAYGKVTFVPACFWKANVSIRAEDDSIGTYLTLEAGLSYEF